MTTQLGNNFKAQNTTATFTSYFVNLKIVVYLFTHMFYYFSYFNI